VYQQGNAQRWREKNIGYAMTFEIRNYSGGK